MQTDLGHTPLIGTATERPKHVLFVENGIGYGGAIICMRHLINGLDRARYIPYVVTGRSGPEYLGLANEGVWRCFRDRHADVIAWRRAAALWAWPARVPLARWLISQVIARVDDLANFLPFFLQLLVFARTSRIDLIHANNEPTCNRAALLVGRLLGIPVVSHVRDPLTGAGHSPLFYRMPDHYIPVSHWVSRRLGELGVEERKRTVTYDGIPLSELGQGADGAAFRARNGLAEDDFAVGLVGLLIAWKGQHLFLDAVSMLRERIPQLKALIVGGTPAECASYEQELRERVRREGLDDIVSFTGHQQHMAEVYQGLNIVVSASTTPEPLGTVVIEAMALGRPLVAPDHGGGAEMAQDGSSALLFRHGNAESLAAAILRLFENPALAAELGLAASARALDMFDISRHAREVQAVYDKVLDSL